MSAPIPVRVTRYRCPHCARSHSSRGGAVGHMARCWFNPDARGCKTCVHFYPGDSADPMTGYPGSDEVCAAGVDLSGRPACTACGGYAEAGTGETATCHVGDGREIKPGPIVGCPLWALRLDISELSSSLPSERS